jgi:hypothetical protein
VHVFCAHFPRNFIDLLLLLLLHSVQKQRWTILRSLQLLKQLQALAQQCSSAGIAISSSSITISSSIRCRAGQARGQSCCSLLQLRQESG